MSNQSTPASHNVARYDLYRGIHKALRAFMTDTLHRVGRADPQDAADVSEALSQVRALLSICRLHLVDENQFVHPAIESRHPGGSARIADEHVHHLDAFAAIETAIGAVQLAAQDAGRARETALLALYHRLSLFVAENFVHMHDEETRHNAILWATHSDAELQAVEGAIVASIPPAQMMTALRWMIPAMHAAERADLLGQMQAGAPPEAFAAVLAHVRPHLAERDWQKLQAALNPLQAAA